MEKTLTIEGMMCRHCAMHVEKALTAIPGVQEVSVNLETKSAQVSLSQDVADETFKAAIQGAGYNLVSVK